ncbi:MAG: tetratricopeptide repeat protein [Gaiellaceae bacterium]
MAAASFIVEPPPVTTLTLVPDGPADALHEAEELIAASRFDAAASALEAVWPDVRGHPELAVRGLLAHAWAEMYRGNLDGADAMLARAQHIAQLPQFDAAARAEVLYRRGCVAFKRAEAAEAIELFTRALETNEWAPNARTVLAAHIYEWRSRCHQFGRDWDAAARDAERSLEIAYEVGDEPSQAHALFQVSLVAERRRDWLLARFNAERALELYERHGDVLSTARILNNLGVINFLLGDVGVAEDYLLNAAETASKAESDVDLAQAVNSLAQLYLRTGRPHEARARANRAVELLDGRDDFRDELGSAQLIVAESLTAEGDADGADTWIDAAEATFTSIGSVGHLANAWVARGDAARATADLDTAAGWYRRAATALADVHF